MENNVIERTAEFVKGKLEKDGTGHDWWHIVRVVRLGKHIAEKEGADAFVVELGCLLHDIADWKLNNGDTEIGPRVAREWLESLGVEEKVIKEITTIISESYFEIGKNETPELSLEAKVVHDADNLDAMGAIGIARTFAFGGAHSRLIHHPEMGPRDSFNQEEYLSHNTTTLNHFYEKLLKLKTHMHTETAKQMAERRHAYMESFVKEFLEEWNGEL